MGDDVPELFLLLDDTEGCVKLPTLFYAEVDVAGDTPLRRAVNCGKVEMATFLRARGVDAGSRGACGLTPRQAARTDAMRQALEGEAFPHGRESASLEEGERIHRRR